MSKLRLRRSAQFGQSKFPARSARRANDTTVHETLKQQAETQRKQPSRCLHCVSLERLKWAEARRRTNDVSTVVRNIMVKYCRNMPNNVSVWTSGCPTRDLRWYRNNLHISNETLTPNTDTQTKHHLRFTTCLSQANYNERRSRVKELMWSYLIPRSTTFLFSQRGHCPNPLRGPSFLTWHNTDIMRIGTR